MADTKDKIEDAIKTEETPVVPTEVKTRNTSKKMVTELEKEVANLKDQLQVRQTQLQAAVNRVAEVEHYLKKLTGL